MQKAETRLAAGNELVTAIPALWVPRPEPRLLAPEVLDPQGMDQVGVRVPHLVSASLLVLNATAKELKIAKDDFLRGHVVAFFPREGAYELRAVYAQQSWMNVGERHRAEGAYELRAVYAQRSWMNVGERHRAEGAPIPLHLLP